MSVNRILTQEDAKKKLDDTIDWIYAQRPTQLKVSLSGSIGEVPTIKVEYEGIITSGVNNG